jgi:lipopolysaccharide/colanic/teichoic acid biosynthesis glycosyltransferase
MYTVVFKRLLDVVVAFTLLVILSPLMIVIYLLLLVTEWENPIFSQERIGLNKKRFTLIKFKSMRTVADEHGNLLPTHLRITFVGGILRKTSLDELPQLINVLKGDMSFIGPRPLFEMYLPYYTEQEQKRHTVRPGITGLAQVRGRNLINWDTKLAYDVEYVDNLSFKLDCDIFFKTIVNTLLSRGVLINDPAKYLNEERKHMMVEKNAS